MSYESFEDLLEYFSVNSCKNVIGGGSRCPRKAEGNNVYRLFKVLTYFILLPKIQLRVLILEMRTQEN